nr:hypothetical protein [Tanacetum cinerariifolium]
CCSTSDKTWIWFSDNLNISDSTEVDFHRCVFLLYPLVKDNLFMLRNEPYAVRVAHLNNLSLNDLRSVPIFVQTFEHVKPSGHSVQPVEALILAATPKPISPKTNSSGKRKNRKTCFVCRSIDHLIKDCTFHTKPKTQPTSRNYAHRGYNKQKASFTQKHPQKQIVLAAVLTKSKPVYVTTVRPVSAAIMMTRPKHTHSIDTKSKSSFRRHITRSQSPKTSNPPPKVTAANASVDGSLFDSSSNNATNDEPRSSCDAGNKDDNGVNKDSGIDAHEKSATSINDVNTVGPSINTASTDVDTGSLNINTDGSLFDSSSNNATNDEPRSSCDAGNKDDNGVNKDSGIDAHEKSATSINDVNTVGPSINTASTDVDTGSLNINTDGSLFDSSSNNATNDEPQSSCDAGNKDDNGVNKDSGIDAHGKSATSINDVNTVGPSINTASTDVDTGSLNINTLRTSVLPLNSS